MATLAQYNHTSSSDVKECNAFLAINAGATSSDNNYYYPSRRITAFDEGTTVDESLQFYDECLRGNFVKGTSYFAHLRFLRQPEGDAGIQKFSIKLVYYDSSDTTEQHIKDITVSQADYLRYIPVEKNDSIDLTNNEYYLKTTDPDTKIVSYTKIDTDNWYTLDIDENGKIVDYTVVQKDENGKFIYDDDGQHATNYYWKRESIIDIKNFTWDDNGNPSDIEYSGINGINKIEIKDNQIISSSFKLLNNYNLGEENPICLLKESPLWGDVEFTFTPLTDFDCLLFTLQRTSSDYQGYIRYPLILYQEISEIQNICGSRLPTNLLKIGVLSHPSLNMFINQEEIRIGGTGIYEIKSGKLVINSFSILAEAQDTDLDKQEFQLYQTWKENKYENTTLTPSYSLISRQLNNESDETILRTRTIDSFTIDYMV